MIAQYPSQVQVSEPLPSGAGEYSPVATAVNVARLSPHFARVQRGPLAPLLRGGDTVSVRRLWILEGYMGGWPARIEP